MTNQRLMVRTLLLIVRVTVAAPRGPVKLHTRSIEVMAPRRPHQEGYDKPGTWHAQVGQDKTIAKLFGSRRDGFFVDLAANHAVINSNTRALERDLGWHGLCIDANVDLLWELANERSCQVLGAVVSSDSGLDATFALQNDDAISGLVANGTDNEHRLSRARQRQYRTVRLLDLLVHVNAPRVIDYLSLDVEGAEDDVLLRFPLNKTGYIFRALTIERPIKPLRQHLTRHGYRYLRDHGCFGDQLWVHSSFVAAAEATLGLVPWDVELAKTVVCQVRQRGVRKGEAPPPAGTRGSIGNAHRAPVSARASR